MKEQAREKRKLSIRKKIIGTKDRPRLNVFRSSKHIYASLVDDGSGKILASASEKEIKAGSKVTKTERAFLVGKAIGERALKKGFKKIVFDRAGYLYHGRVARLAEGAKEAGLKI